MELRNPHSVLAALETRPQSVVEIRLHSHQPRGAWKDVVAQAERLTIRVRRDVLRDDTMHRGQGRQSSPKSGRTGAAEATVKQREAVSLEELWGGVEGRQSVGRLWVALDHLQDPHNVGAVFRTAAFFGVAGIILTRDRSAPLSATTYDVAAGGMEHVPFSLQTNLSRALEVAKAAGVWILGTSEHAEQDIAEFHADRPWLLVIGNEEKGIRRLTQTKCDALCRLTPQGAVTSLNASVAAGLLIAALSRHE
jgi:23S rRNA (guanosine2251-2'-O)-methyltransferase